MIRRLLPMGGGGSFPNPLIPFVMTSPPYGIGTDIQWPMAIAGNGKTFVGLIQGETDANDVSVASWNNATGALIETRQVKDQLSPGTVPDTHNQPAINYFSDGTLIMAMCGHGGTTMYIYTSDAPWVTTSGFTPIATFTSSRGMTYPQVAILASDRVYIRYRGVSGGVATLCQRYSDDGGVTWSSELLLFSDGTDNLYSAMACNGTRIDQIIIPRAPAYASGWPMGHFYLEGGTYKKTDGSTIAVGDPPSPLISSDLTSVFAAGSYRFPRGIVYNSGVPVLAWDSAQANPVLEGESRWSGSSWDPTTIVSLDPLYTGTTSVGGGKHKWDNADVFLTGALNGALPIDMGGTSGIYRIRRTGGVWGSPVRVDDGSLPTPYSPITVVNADPEVAFVWPYGDQAPGDGDPFSMGLEGVA